MSDPKSTLPVPLGLVIDRLAGDVVLTLHGELDLSGKEAFEELLDEAADGKIENVFVDLRGLTFIDSTGISLLLRTAKLTEELELGVGFVPAEGHVQELLDSTGVSAELRFVEVNELPRL